MIRSLLVFVPLAVAACGGAASQSGTSAPESPGTPATAPTPTSSLDGVFTEPQAERGRAAFRQACADCHASSDFRGEKFYLSWEGSSVGRFVTSVIETMPDDDPGSLPTQIYLDVTAYVLSLNGMPAGEAEITDDVERLNGVRIERPAEAGADAGVDAGGDVGAHRGTARQGGGA